MFKFRQNNRVVGISKKTRLYDLPLDKGAGGWFLKILIALMTFLAILALSASFVLGAMTERWTSGLQNKASVEIPAEKPDGEIASAEEIETLTQDVEKYLVNHPAVVETTIMSKEEISDLVSPWLGEGLEFENVPVPGIISVSFKSDVEFDKEGLAQRIKDVAPQARLDFHESWLNDVLKFTGALNFAAMLITLVIGLTTIFAVSGAIQSRMAIYKEELELLHLMGASDNYISRQLQRYIFMIALKGAVIGSVIGGITLLIIGWLAGRMEITLLPDFSLSGSQIMILLILAPIIAIVGMLAARHTVLRTLSLMP